MSTTPRTDAARIASGFQAVPSGFEDFARALETELAAAKAECNLNRTRIASIFWSGVMDKLTGGDVQKWASDYTAELTDMTARAEKAETEVARLRAENKLLRAAQKISEDSDGAIIMEVISLRAEVERLNALGSWSHTCIHHNDEQRAKAKGCPVCAIDAAMKEASK